MQAALKDAEHLFRVAALFLGALIAFLVVRAVLVPDDFGKYGHYRAGAILDNMARPAVFGGRAVCADCHDAVVSARTGGKHEGVGCESCHGPAAAHAADPTTGSPPRPDSGTLCAGCHESRSGRPAWFPQIDLDDHASDTPCVDCHAPHHPDS